MNSPILIGLSPNIESDDVRLALKTLLQPWRWYNGAAVQELEQQLSRFFLGRRVVALSSGRAALYHALNALDIGQDDEVIVQAFTCVAVPAAVMWTGATPVYADIDPATYTVNPHSLIERITPATKAIVFQHTFGNPAHLRDVLAIARQHNLMVIEDCAHAFGSEYDGQPVGTWGDVAIVSFGRDKSLSSVFGGALITSDHALATRIRRAVATLKNPPLLWVKQQLLHPILLSLIKPLYFLGPVGKTLLVALQKLGLLSKAVATQEKAGGRPDHLGYQYVPALARLALHQLHKVDRFTEQRLATVRRYRAAGLPGSDPGERISWLRYPLRVANPERLLEEAATQHMLLGDWYRTAVFPVADPKNIHYTPGSCPEAEKAAAEVLNLPTYPTLTADQIERVIALVRRHIQKSVV